MNKKYTIEDFIQDRDYITGSGGGKSASSKTPIEAPNTLQSRSTIRVVEILSEGEIVGVVGGQKGCYLDDTVIQNPDDSFNYPGCKFDERQGTLTQDYMPGFPGVESALVINVEVDTVPLVRTVSSSTVDAARITVRLPSGLTNLDKKSGNLNGHRVGFAIDVRPTGAGVWTQAISKVIQGKATTAYEASFRVEKPAGISTTWDIRVRRTTVKSESSAITERIDWFALTEIQDIKIYYPNAAYVGQSIDSEATGGAVPKRSYLVDGLIIKVPSNYTPTVYGLDGSIESYAEYTGSWDGTFIDSWCDDPAWILYDILTNERYGMGEYIDTSNIDIYSFYEASRYCCELIDDGTGTDTLAPRFTMNLVLGARDDAYKVIQSLAASFRSVIFSGPGYLKLIQDRPQAPSAIITNANVIDGNFNYVGSELAARLTSCDVTFNDRFNSYRPRTINEEASPEVIAAYGFNKQELTALGCVNEAEARRLAKWALDSAIASKEAVTFQVSWQNAFMEIGDVINISDNFYAGAMYSGVLNAIPSGTADQIKFDREVSVTAGDKVLFTTFTGVQVERTFAATATGTTFALVTVVDSLNPNDYPGAPFVVVGEVEPRQFKVSSVKESSVGIYEISAGYYDPTKFARIEDGVYVAPPVFTNIGSWSVGKPENLAVTPESYINPQGILRYRLRFNWDDVIDPLLRNYKVQWRRDNSAYHWSMPVTQSEFTLDDCIPGVYEYNVYAYNTRSVQSPPASDYFELVVGDGVGSTIDPVTDLELIGGGTSFQGTNFQITWTAPAEINTATLMDYEIKLYDGTSSSDELIQTIYTPNVGYIFDRSNIIAWAGSAIRSIYIAVRARDTLERFSTVTGATFTNPAPDALSSLSATPFFNNYLLEHGAYASDTVSVKIHHSTSTGFTPSGSNLVLDDVGFSHLIAANSDTTYYIRAAAYDTWSEDLLNYSSEITVTTNNISVGITPDAVTGLAASSVIIETSPGVQQARVTVSWNRATNASSYDLEVTAASIGIAEGVMVPDPGTGSTVTYTFVGVPATAYTFRVRARSAAAVSIWSSVVNHTTVGDTVAPGTPTSLTTSSGFNAAVLNWVNPSASDLASIQVYRRQTAPTTVAEALVATVAAPIGFYYDSGRTTGATYEYRIRALDTSGNASGYTSYSSIVVTGLPANSVVTTTITDNSIVTSHMTANTINGDRITANTLNANKIIANSITATQIAANTITSGQIDANSIRTAVLTANSITTAMLQAGSITATTIGTNQIITNSANIANAVIVNANILDATIQGAKIADATITNAKITGNIQSDNYVAATSGWQLNKSTGALELNGVTGGVGRTKLSASGLNVYDSAGTLRVRVGIW